MKRYADLDPKRGWPSQAGLFYECTLCGDVFPSRPSGYIRCQCRNFSIDVEAGRMGAKNESAIRLFEEVSE